MNTHKQVPNAQASVHQQGCWRSRDGAETSPTVQVEMRRSSRDVSDSIQKHREVDISCTTDNRQQKKVAARAVPESSEEDRDSAGSVAIQHCAHDTTLEKTFDERDTLNQAVVRIVNETARAWSIECLQYEIREIISPASIKQAMEMQAEGERR